MAQHTAKGSFAQGFDIKGFNETTMGADLIATYLTPDTWVEGTDGERYVTAPIQLDLAVERGLKDCPDGELPDGYLYRNVTGAELTVNDFVNPIPENEVKAGDPVDYVRHVGGAFLRTSLLDGTNTPVKGDDVYIDTGLYANADPLSGSGVSVGTVVDDETGEQETGKVLIKLA